MIRLTGSQNQVIKEVRALKNRKEREERGLYFIEGVRFIEEALKEKADIKYFIVSDTFASDNGHKQLLEDMKKIPYSGYIVPDRLFESISDTKTPQGILAVIRMKKLQLGDFTLTGGIAVILENIKDPGNMGTIIRTADAAGCECVIVPDGCVDVYNPKVLRSTMGSVFHIPVCHCESVEEAIEFVSSKGYKLFASHLEGSISIYDADFNGSIALIIGSEAEGISSGTVEKSDQLIRIPMAGSAESLNASVAAGVMMFEAMRQRIYRKR